LLIGDVVVGLDLTFDPNPVVIVVLPWFVISSGLPDL
jgi:hypothetical protein